MLPRLRVARLARGRAWAGAAHAGARSSSPLFAWLIAGEQKLSLWCGRSMERGWQKRGRSVACALTGREHQPSKLGGTGSSSAAVASPQNGKAPPGCSEPGRGCPHRGQIGVSLAARETPSRCLVRGWRLEVRQGPGSVAFTVALDGPLLGTGDGCDASVGDACGSG